MEKFDTFLKGHNNVILIAHNAPFDLKWIQFHEIFKDSTDEMIDSIDFFKNAIARPFFFYSKLFSITDLKAGSQVLGNPNFSIVSKMTSSCGISDLPSINSYQNQS